MSIVPNNPIPYAEGQTDLEHMFKRKCPWIDLHPFPSYLYYQRDWRTREIGRSSMYITEYSVQVDSDPYYVQLRLLIMTPLLRSTSGQALADLPCLACQSGLVVAKYEPLVTDPCCR